MTTRAVCVDVMGTLFDLSAPRRRLGDLGAPPATLEAWFGRLLHTAATVTLIDDYRPFPDLASPATVTLIADYRPSTAPARPVLKSVLAQLNPGPGSAPHVLDALAQLDPYPD